MVAASLPVGSLCTGSVWRSPDGRTVEVLEYKDQVPVYDRPYDLELCNAGAALSPGESVDAQRWRGVS